VHGFVGPDPDLAITRGDVEGALVSLSSARPLLVNAQARALFYFGTDNVLPGVEKLDAVARSDRERNAANKLLTLSGLGRLSAGPPGIPPVRLQKLRRAYLDALSDPELRDEAARMRLPIQPWGGERVASAIQQLSEDP
jgi:hypothetical protein